MPSRTSNAKKNNKNRKKSTGAPKVTPYAMVVASVGVVAFSTAIFSLSNHITANGFVVEDVLVISSGTNVSAPTPQASLVENNKDKDKDKDKDSQSSDDSVYDAVAAVDEKILTGKELDDILASRTGVSALSGIHTLPTSNSVQKTNSSTIPDADDTSSSTPVSSSSSASDTPSASSSSEGSSSSEASSQAPKINVAAKYTAASIGSSGYANISSWKAKNSDVVGWLRIPNTNIDYPVVVGPNNMYYSELGYQKEASKNGVIWADSYTKFGTRDQISQNNVLYGHNWTNYTATPYIGRSLDVMFAQLASYHYLDFAKNTPYIHYSTESEEMVWKVFAVFYTEESFNYIESDGGADYMQTLVSEAKSRSLHSFDVDVNSSDKVLTLSTCTRAYGQRDDQRFVVMARLVRANEEISEVAVSANPNFKRPQF